MSNIGVVVICLIFSAFFSGIEIAFISADKLRIELLFQQGKLTGRILSFFQKRWANFLTTTLVGNNLALVIYGIIMARLIDPWLGENLPAWASGDIIILVIQTIIATIIVLITAEFIPKSLFLLDPDFMLSVLAIPIFIVYVIMFPFVKIVEFLSKFIIVKIFGMNYSETKPVFGLIDLNNYIKKNTIGVDQEQAEIDARIFSNAIEFKEVKVRECMIPRTEIVAIDVTEDISVLVNTFIESGHSKIIVCKESIDDVIGYCHSMEMFKKPESIKKILTDIIIIPETLPASELLVKFVNERKSIALVVDEFGGTSGIVCMEDVMEEIFGEIRDEHDEETLAVDQLSDNCFMLSGRHEIDYLNEKYNWGLPDGEYDTLGGFILEKNENIPKLNDTIVSGKFSFKIASMEGNRIDKVKLTINESENDL